METSPNLNREGWLTELALQIEPVFKGFAIAKYRVTCGWPSTNALGMKSRRIGECHSSKSSKGDVFEIFVSPLLDVPIRVAGVLTHEITHIVAGIDAGHGPGFKKVCKIVGLTNGKPTEAMPGTLLEEKLDKIVEKLGPYPHQAIVPTLKTKKPPSSISLVCAECGCRISMSKKWHGEVGAPTCGCGGEMTEKSGGEDG